MALYEIDTVKQSLKKYAVVLTVGLGVGLYLSNCAFKPITPESKSKYALIEAQVEQNYPPNTVTREEQRLKVFETYTRP